MIAKRLGPIQLTPGYSRLNGVTFIYAAFVTIGLLAFISFIQAYLLNVNLKMPPELQGRTVAILGIANEIVALVLVAPFGALADKIGRRLVYTFGFAWLAIGFLLYPEARTLPQLLACALFFSVGVAAVGTMLATVLADTPLENSRGKLVGITGLFQGLGVMIAVLGLGKVPELLAAGGMDDQRAGQITLWIAAGIAALSALAVFIGLKKGSPRRDGGAATSLAFILREGLTAARSNPRIWFAYMLQFVSFGDRIVIGTFLSLRLQQTALEHGMSMAAATGAASRVFGMVSGAALIGALIFGVLLDRLDRLKTGVFAMALGATAYFAGGFIDDPTAMKIVAPVCLLLGFGQVSAIIASQTMLGQEAPISCRGAVFGLAGICASAGILFTNGAGGWLYDQVSKGGPFFLMAGASFGIMLFGLWLLRRAPVTAPAVSQ
ncbi:MAG: MFS transporter [Pseudomonadales bacterium]|nr:MFS transporter [Pseudomonadales bacterium]